MQCITIPSTTFMILMNKENERDRRDDKMVGVDQFINPISKAEVRSAIKKR